MNSDDARRALLVARDMAQEGEASQEQVEGGDEDKAAYATAQRFESKAQLKPFQREAVQEVAKHAKWRPMPRMSTEGEKEEDEPTEKQLGKAGGPHGIDARSIATKCVGCLSSSSCK